MKKTLALAAFVLMLMPALAQVATTPTPSADLAVAAFESQTFTFGKIKQGTPVTHEFTFTNKGKVPLVITNVQASCGCTTPDWSKTPVPPGATGYVKATYNAAAPGNFNKSVTVTANVEGGVIYLSIQGEVVAQVP